MRPGIIHGIRHMADHIWAFFYLGFRFGMWNRRLLTRLHWPIWYEWPGPGTGDYCCERCGGHPFDFGESHRESHATDGPAASEGE